MSVRRVHGPYAVGKRWRVITKHEAGKRSSAYYATRDQAESAMKDAERTVSASVGIDAVVAALVSQAVSCPSDPAWLYFLRGASGDVIYIGVTGKIGNRLDAHIVAGKPFVGVWIVPSPFERSIALELERMLVRALRPALNRHHNPDSEPGTRDPLSSSGEGSGS